MCLEKEEIDYNVFREYTFHLLQIIRQYLQYTFRRRLVHCLWQSIVLYVVTETFPHTLGILQAHDNRSLVILDQFLPTSFVYSSNRRNLKMPLRICRTIDVISIVDIACYTVNIAMTKVIQQPEILFNWL